MTTANRNASPSAGGGQRPSSPRSASTPAVASASRRGTSPSADVATGRKHAWTDRLPDVVGTPMDPATSARRTAPAPQGPKRGSGALTRRARAWRADLIFTLIAVETGIAVGLGIQAQPWSDWGTPSLAVTALSRVLAMAGTALALVALLLAARIPWIERSVGQDRLIKWHRVVGPYSLWFITAHVILVTIGYSLADKINAWSEWWRLALTYPWMLPALAGFGAMVMIGVTSYKRARRRMKYETWWVIHLYSYLGISLSFMHQVTDGIMFVGHPAMKDWWMLFTLSTFALIAWFRILVPFVSSLYHGFKVERVIVENHHAISVVMKGRKLDELQAQGGQFFGFRFMTKRYWWESHPYSISAAPRNDRIRITVKDLGDHSSWLRTMKPGTRVWIEGPYGVFTADEATTGRVTLIAGGVGITPIRALLEEFPHGTSIDLVWRASHEDDLMLRHEVESLAEWHGARVHYVIGSRTEASLDVRTLRHYVPHIKHTDVFLCGPGPVVEQAKASAEALGVPTDRIHDEAFAY